MADGAIVVSRAHRYQSSIVRKRARPTSGATDEEKGGGRLFAGCQGPETIEIDYVFHGTLCVVPYIARLRSTRTAGRIVEIKVRVLDVYAQEDGDWHQVASHMSLHPDTLVASDAAVALFQGSDED
ncbi:MAG: hypothetical protein PVI07_04570 [Anaerolineae bacterium]|jgi:ketosteroid isomerase-like protein